MNFRRSASASLRPCRYAAPLRGRPTRSGGGAPSELPDPNRDSPALTRTSNHSKSSTNQQETPQSFNNGWDIPEKSNEADILSTDKISSELFNNASFSDESTPGRTER